jgi:protein gp37
MLGYSERRAIPDHVWLGVSAENQACHDERALILRAVRAKVRFFLLEPRLGPMAVDWLPSG